MFLLHGGPGAPGYLAPVAKVLGKYFRVIEPMQRKSSNAPLTVAQHVADLHELIKSPSDNERPALVGHSWGAMLALAYASTYPDAISCSVLIGCGTFDVASRKQLELTRNVRMDNKLMHQVQRVENQTLSPNERMEAMGRLNLQLDSYRLGPVEDKMLTCDARGHEETWRDMMRLQAAGTYPESFSSIYVPSIMLHGAYDPHPGHMIHESLRPYMPQLAYKLWLACGHYPWLEREAKEEFYTTLLDWLSQHA